MGRTKTNKEWGVGLYLAPIPQKVKVTQALKDLWAALVNQDPTRFTVCVTNKTGEQTLRKMIKKGYIIEQRVDYTFSDQAIKNMMQSYDAETGRMEITGKVVQ